MQVQEILGAEFREILIGANPVLSPFELCKPSCCFGFCQSLCLLLLVLSPCFGDKQPTVTEGSNEVR